MNMRRFLLPGSPAACARAAALAVLLAGLARGQVIGSTNTLSNVAYATPMWSLSDPFAFRETSNLLAAASASAAAAASFSNRLSSAESSAALVSNGLVAASASLTGALAAETNRAQAAEAALASRALALESGTNSAAQALALAQSALQPPATNAMNVLLTARVVASTNGLASALGPRISALEAAGYLPASATNGWSWVTPASTNGWNVAPFKSWILAADALAMIRAEVDAGLAALPGITNIVTGVLTAAPPSVSNAVVSMVSPLLSVSNGVSPAGLSAWWSTNSPHTPAQLFSFSTNGGYATVTGGPDLPYVSIPPLLGGLPVRVLGGNCFNGRTNLVDIRIPDTVRDVGPLAFHASGLRTVSFPDSVTNIGDSVLGYCDFITEVRFGAGLEALGGGAASGGATAHVDFYFYGPAPAADAALLEESCSVYRLAGAAGYTPEWAEASYSPAPQVFGPDTAAYVVLNGVTNAASGGVVDLGALGAGAGAGVTNLIVAATNGIPAQIAAATNGLPPILSASSVSNIASAVSGPQGPVVALLSTNGSEFVTLEPGGALTGWQVVDTNNWYLTWGGGGGFGPVHAFDLSLPFPLQNGVSVFGYYVKNTGTMLALCSPDAEDEGAYLEPFSDGLTNYTFTSGVSSPAEIVYASRVATNAVRTYASLAEVTNRVTYAAFLSASNALAQAAADAQATADESFAVSAQAAETATAASQNAANAYSLAEYVQLDLLPLKADASNGVFTGTLTLNGDTIASWPTGGSSPTVINVTTASVITVAAGSYYINIADWAATASVFSATAELDMTPEFTVTGRYEFAFSDLGGGRVRGKQTWPSVYAWLEQPRATANGNADMGYALSSLTALTDAQITNSVYISAVCDCPALVRVSYSVNNAASRTNAVAIYAGVWVAGVGEAYTTNVLATIYPTGTAFNTQTAVFVLPSRTQLASTVGLGQYAGFDWVRYGLRHARAGATAGYIYVQCVRTRPLGANERLAYDAGWRP